MRGLLYDKGVVSYKLCHGTEWILLARCPTRRQSTSTVSVPQLNTSPLKISGDKFTHLQELKAMTPLEHHQFNDMLYHN